MIMPLIRVCIARPPNEDGDIFLDLIEKTSMFQDAEISLIERPRDIPVSSGDKLLCELTRDGKDKFDARLVQKINEEKIKKTIGSFRSSNSGGVVELLEKSSYKSWSVIEDNLNGASDGDLVEIEQIKPKTRFGLPEAKVLSILGNLSDNNISSLIAINEHNIADEFSNEVLLEANECNPINMGDRKDLRDIAFVTIDPEDAKDHDDACYVEADQDKKNAGGFIIWIAIADVSYYVKKGTALDREALKRGNSTYFPDRVVPMLPDKLSGDLCSIHEGEDRPCLALKMTITSEGKHLDRCFFRGIINSRASLNYHEVQDAYEGKINKKTGPLLETVIKPLYNCYEVLQNASKKRQPLNLELPERKVFLDENDNVRSIDFLERFTSNKIIEELMVLANTVAAEELFNKNRLFLHRIHVDPEKEKIESLRQIAKSCGLSLSKGQVLKTYQLNSLLNIAKETEYYELISISILRSMSQAYYGPEPTGHFGLALKRYTHFTSPIRRYSDLMIHRALVEIIDGKNPAVEMEELKAIGNSISKSERVSMLAERDTIDRYLASFLSSFIDTEIEGTISGVARFGIFVKVDKSGADGLVPVASIGNEYFKYDPRKQLLVGRSSGFEIGIGKRVLVRILESNPFTGSLTLELIKVDDKAIIKKGTSKLKYRKRWNNKVTRRRKKPR